MKRLALIKDTTKFWTVYKPELEKYGVDVVLLDIFKKKDQEQLLNEKWDGFIWRAKHDPKFRDLAKRFISLFDKKLGIKTFPSWNDYWLYDDKMAQSFIFQKLNIPTPKTFVFYDKKEALDFVDKYEDYPIVYKSSSGAGSANVGLFKNKSLAKRYIKKAFGKGIKTFFKEDIQRFYVYFQEFLSNNEGGYRVVCHSNKMLYGYYKYNDENSKFATGLGKIDFSPISNDLLEFSFNVHKLLGFPQVMSYDIFKDNTGNFSVLEMSVVYSGLDSFQKNIEAVKFEITEENKFIQMEKKNNYHEFFIESLLKEWGWID